jgi:hypothetical protein
LADREQHYLDRKFLRIRALSAGELWPRRRLEIGFAVRFHAHATISRVFRLFRFFAFCTALLAAAPVDCAEKTATDATLATPGEFAADALLRIPALQ